MPILVGSYGEFTPGKEDSIFPLWEDSFIEKLDKFHENQRGVAKYTFYKDVYSRNADCHFDLKYIKKDTPYLIDVAMRNRIGAADKNNNVFLKWIISKESPWYAALKTAVIKIDEEGNPLSWLWPDLANVPCLLASNFCIAARQINEHRKISYPKLLRGGATIKEAFYLQYYSDSSLDFSHPDNWHKPFNYGVFDSNSGYFLNSPNGLKTMKDDGGSFTPRSNHIWYGKDGLSSTKLESVFAKGEIKGLLDYIRQYSDKQVRNIIR